MSELKQEVEVADEVVRMDLVSIIGGEPDRRCCRWRLGFQIGTERLELHPRLHFLDVGDVVGAVQRDARERHHQGSFRGKYLLDAFRRCARPAGAGNQVAGGVVTRGTRADVGEVVCEQVDPLLHVVASLGHLGNGDHPGLSAQVQPGPRIGRVVVGGHNVMVVGCIELRVMPECPEATDVFRSSGRGHLLVQGVVVFEHRKRVDVGLFGDRSRLRLLAVAGGRLDGLCGRNRRRFRFIRLTFLPLACWKQHDRGHQKQWTARHWAHGHELDWVGRGEERDDSRAQPAALGPRHAPRSCVQRSEKVQCHCGLPATQATSAYPLSSAQYFY